MSGSSHEHDDAAENKDYVGNGQPIVLERNMSFISESSSMIIIKNTYSTSVLHLLLRFTVVVE